MECEIFCRSGPYQEAADAMSRLSRKASEDKDKNADVNKNISRYCIFKQEGESSDAYKLGEVVVEPLPTTIEMKIYKQMIRCARTLKSY